MFQGTASEATLVALLSARSKTLKTVKAETGMEDEEIMGKLVFYCSGMNAYKFNNRRQASKCWH